MAVNHCWCIQLSQRANAPICLHLNNLTRQVKLVNSEKCIHLCRECDWTYLRLPDRDFDLDFDERDECRLGLRRGDTDRRGELHINHMYILYTLWAKNATVFSYNSHTHTHTRLTALCPGLPGWAGTKKVKPIRILLKESPEWQWHLLGHVQICTSLQTDNHASTPPLSFLQARC